MSDAHLDPLGETGSERVVLNTARPFVIGSASEADLLVAEPGVEARHCVLEFQGQRWVIVEAASSVLVNGAPLGGATLLFDRDRLAISVSAQWEFVSGEARTAELPVVNSAHRATQMHKRHRNEAFAAAGAARPWRVYGVVAAAGVCVLLAFVAIWYARHTTADTSGILTDQQAVRFDSLLIVAYDHLERGNSLLELGIQDDAAQEFARGINTLALSELRNHPQVKPRIEALESSVAAIYRERRLAVPDAYAGARSTLSPEKLRTATLSRDQFAHAFDLVSAAFRLRYHDAIIVVGRDHAEHLALYGPGGALDLRSMSMSAEQVAYVIAQCRSYGIRVKDFSQDSILQRQIKAAFSAGVGERAGTGLHLHIDRFADRRDQWTIGALPERSRSDWLLRQTSRNLRRVTPESVNSEPSWSSRGSPRSNGSSSTDVPLRLESIR